jgi:hypothetical protein
MKRNVILAAIAAIIFTSPLYAGAPVKLNNKEIIGEWCNYRYDDKEMMLDRKFEDKDCGDIGASVLPSISVKGFLAYRTNWRSREKCEAKRAS